VVEAPVAARVSEPTSSRTGLVPARREVTGGFHIWAVRQGVLYDGIRETFPTRVYGWHEEAGPLTLREPTSSFFGYVVGGRTQFSSGAGTYELAPGQYFCVQAGVRIEGGHGLVVERGDYRALDVVGGPVESKGRLRYIDGCTDTLLVPPVKRGDACLNALFFPEGINQTLHTHPSIRVGVVASGRGECRTARSVIPLLPGRIFVIEEDSIHGFHTPDDSGMVVIAYHPDTDFGPVDIDHPMINRTIVDGVSASRITEIQTR
jgi:quercetin dioxygenase-like cupin family protein